MICTTTTPFQKKDVALILGHSPACVSIAWAILKPHFGTQLTFGCGRVEASANFFDVVAMSTLITLLTSPIEVELISGLSMEVADEVALILDRLDCFEPFSDQQLAILLRDLRCFLKQYSFGKSSIEGHCWKLKVENSVLRAIKSIRVELKKLSLGGGTWPSGYVTGGIRADMENSSIATTRAGVVVN